MLRRLPCPAPSLIPNQPTQPIRVDIKFRNAPRSVTCARRDGGALVKAVTRRRRRQLLKHVAAHARRRQRLKNTTQHTFRHGLWVACNPTSDRCSAVRRATVAEDLQRPTFRSPEAKPCWACQGDLHLDCGCAWEVCYLGRRTEEWPDLGPRGSESSKSAFGEEALLFFGGGPSAIWGSPVRLARDLSIRLPRQSSSRKHQHSSKSELRWPISCHEFEGPPSPNHGPGMRATR